MTTDQEIRNLEEILHRRTRFFWLIIGGCILSLILMTILLFMTARISKQNGEIAIQNQNYIRCLAGAFVQAQDKKITTLDLDSCLTVLEDNKSGPVPVPTPSLPGATGVQNRSTTTVRGAQGATGAQGTQGQAGQNGQSGSILPTLPNVTDLLNVPRNVPR